eukprot:GILI01000630.1.p1 GENE.GILI01000630.1~~GILI01000630.1.p1  ORF type:complete len:388 (-),score=124.67 GILI01000630.1:196-1308(-)
MPSSASHPHSIPHAFAHPSAAHGPFFPPGFGHRPFHDHGFHGHHHPFFHANHPFFHANHPFAHANHPFAHSSYPQFTPHFPPFGNCSPFFPSAPAHCCESYPYPTHQPAYPFHNQPQPFAPAGVQHGCPFKPAFSRRAQPSRVPQRPKGQHCFFKFVQTNPAASVPPASASATPASAPSAAACPGFSGCYKRGQSQKKEQQREDLSAAVLEHLTYPAETPVTAGEQITKVLRLQNNGSQAWPQGSTLALVRGDVCNFQPVTLAEAVQPGEEFLLCVDLEVPEGSEEGSRFSSRFTFIAPASSSPASASASSSSSTATPAKSLSERLFKGDLVTVDLRVLSKGPSTPKELEKGEKKAEKEEGGEEFVFLHA